MPEHIYEKADLVQRFEAILDKPLSQIDHKGIFAHLQDLPLQKGVAGTVVEQCVLGYDPDSRQEPDLVVLDGGARCKTELKTTGMVLTDGLHPRFTAKEPLSVTAVGIYDLAEQEFSTSHFWRKLEHLLLVYYHYTADKSVPPYAYRDFPVKGYEFHTFSPEDVEILRQDWQQVHDLAAQIVSRHPGARDGAWRAAVKAEYLALHGQLRQKLTYIDLAPKFPPRFRLKKPVVSAMIARHFGQALEQLPGRYDGVSALDKKCRELTALYRGKTMAELAALFGLSPLSSTGREDKGLAERLTAAMFGGKSRRLDQIELFQRFGLVAKTVAVTAAGGRTEDMKLFRLDFGELSAAEIFDDDGQARLPQFEGSQIWSYFADHALLCILYEEPAGAAGKPHPLSADRFVGFKRLVFSDAFLDGPVRRLWSDLREKVLGGTLRDVVELDRTGAPRRNPSGGVRSAPNFLKSRDNPVFVRGSGRDASPRRKTVEVGGVRMLPQYVWLRGSTVVDELRRTDAL